MFELLIFGVAFVILLLASIEDLKTREVPDYLNYFLIGAAIVIRLLWFVWEQNLEILYWIPVAFGMFFGFSYLMYKSGQWGGGDVKIMVGISILLSAFPGESIPFFLNFFFNILVVGAVYGIFSMGILGIIRYDSLKSYLTRIEKILPFVGLAVVGILFFLLQPIYAFFASLFVISIILFKYFKKIEKYCMERIVPVKEATEGDWLVSDIKIGKTVIKKQGIGLTLEDLEKMRKLEKSGKLKKVKIKFGIPFVPTFFITLLVTYFIGNVLLKLFF